MKKETCLEVSAQALQGRRDAIDFPRPLLPGTWEFSFSGIKTSVSYYLRDHQTVSVPDVCASFEQAVCETLVKKTLKAAQTYKVKYIAVGGGVAANSLLREMMTAQAAKRGLQVRFVPRKMSSDNAAMIALAAWRQLEHCGEKAFTQKDAIAINPNLKVKNWGKK